MAEAAAPPDLAATQAVLDQIHAHVSALGSLADAADGLVELLEKEAAERADGKTLALRAIVRLATAVGEDAGKIHQGLDHLWLGAVPGVRVEAAA